MRRAISLDGTGVVLEISKLTSVKGDRFNCIHFDMLPDGTWRITYGENVVKEFSDIKNISIIRENDDEDKN